MALLEIKNLAIEFHDTVPPTKIVENISFSMEEGEILGIVGESGSGKRRRPFLSWVFWANMPKCPEERFCFRAEIF